MQKESSIVGAAKAALASAKAGKAAIGKEVMKAYRPIKSISPAAIGGGLVAGHLVGGYSGSAAAQAGMYHVGYNDAMKKQAGLGQFVQRGITAARGFVTRNGNSVRGLAASPVAKRVSSTIKANPIKATVGAGAAGLAVGSMTKSSGVLNRGIALARLYGRKAPTATKIVAGTTAGALGLGVTHVADEKLDGAAGRAAVYNFRKNNGSI